MTVVFSICGVVLIARPPILFGHGGPSLNLGIRHYLPSAEEGSPTERLIAVGYEHSVPLVLQCTDGSLI
jgi:hypothetical protein